MADRTILDGGLQYIPVIALAQIIYLDFDGELTSYNGEILSLENVEVQDALLTAERISNIVTQLNAKYADQNVVFVTERPTTNEYSTIFIGKASAFDEYGNFAGLAETIDEGNLNKSDNAFVMFDSSASNEAIIATISHETDHLLGTLDHGRNGISSYAAPVYRISAGKMARNMKLQDAYLEIFSGGSAINTTLSSYGYMYVFSGGTAVSTTVNSMGHLTISGVANYITLNSFGSAHVYIGGIANYTTVNENCWINIYGTASRTTVNSLGSISITSRGRAYFTTVNSGGLININSGGTASSTVVKSSGYMKVFSGGSAKSTDVHSGASMFVYSGGIADSITINNGGVLYISQGGTASIVFDPWLKGTVYSADGAEITYLEKENNVYYGNWASGTLKKNKTISNLYISSGYSAIIYSGGTANYASITSGASMFVYSGGIANSVTVSSAACMFVYSGGTATAINALSGAKLDIIVTPGTYMQGTSGGINFLMKDAALSNYTINAYGSVFICSNGNAISCNVNSGGRLFISSGGTANSITLNSGGRLFISSGGTATNLIWAPCYGTLLLEDGAFFTFDQQYSGVFYGSDYQLLSHAERVDSQTLTIHGSMYIFSDGTASDNTIHKGGVAYVFSGGIAENTNVYAGKMYVTSNGTANGTVVASHGCVSVFCGAIVNDTVVNPQGSMTVFNGGAVNNTIVSSGGNTIIESGGIANGISVGAGGYLHIASGGTATDVVWQPLVGTLTIDDGAFVTFASECIGVYYGSKNLTRFDRLLENQSVNSNYSMYIPADCSAVHTNVYGGHMIVASNALASDTRLAQNGAMYVSSGGRAEQITIADKGYMSISCGGNAEQIIFSGYGGTMRVSSGGSAENILFARGGKLTVSAGGYVNSVTIEEDGRLEVASGGTALNIDWTPCFGSVYTAVGASVTFTSKYSGVYYRSNTSTLFWRHTQELSNCNLSGSVCVMSGGVITNVSLVASADANIWNEGQANRVEILSNAFLTVSSGGSAYNTTVSSGGCFAVSNGGIANNITQNGGNIYVGDGGIARYISGTDISVVVSSGGEVADIEISSNSYLRVEKGGIASNITWTPGVGRVYIDPQASVSFTSKLSGVYGGTSGHQSNVVSQRVGRYGASSLYVMSGGSANVTSVVSNGCVFIWGEGISDDLTVSTGGQARIYSGGSAKTNYISSGGSLLVHTGGVIDCTSVFSGGSIILEAGGSANNTWIQSGGYIKVDTNTSLTKNKLNDSLTVVSGCFIYDTIIDRGYLHISSGGTAVSTTISDYIPGGMWVSHGGYASAVSASGGTLAILQYGSAQKVYLNQYAFMDVMSEGRVSDIVIYSGGSCCVSGFINNCEIKSGGNLFVSPDGFAENVTISTGGKIRNFSFNSEQFISEICGDWISITDEVYIKSNELHINSNGVFSGTNINSSNTFLKVNNGGVADDVSVLYGTAFVSSGGEISNLRLDSYGRVNVSSGGIINNATVNGYAGLIIDSGGFVDNLKLDNGYVSIASGGIANILYNPWGGSVASSNGATINYVYDDACIFIGNQYSGLISSAQTISGKTISANLSAIICDKGYMSNMTLESRATLIISNGGIVDKISAAGSMFISSGGQANSITLNNAAVLDVFDKGSANQTIVNSAVFHLYGGYANNTVISSGGVMSVGYAGIADNINVLSGGSLYISSGGTATNIYWKPFESVISVANGAVITYNSSCSGVFYGVSGQLRSQAQTMSQKGIGRNEKMYVLYNGILTDGYVEHYGQLYINSGGIASNTIVFSQGSAFVENGGVAYNTLVKGGGDYWQKIHVYDGGLAYSTTLSGYRACMEIFSGATVSKTFVESWADFYIYGGTATETSVENAEIIISGQGTVIDTDLYYFGSLTISGNGSAVNTTIFSGGGLTIGAGGIACNTVLSGQYYRGPDLNILSNGIACNTIIKNGGKIYVAGLISNTSIGKGGSMTVSSGGYVAGSLDIEDGGFVQIHSGGVIQFNLCDQKSNNDALINNLSMISGTPDYTITVSADQEYGTYKLAQEAEDFSATVSIGDGTVNYGSLIVNGDNLIHNKAIYSLNQIDGNLNLTISEVDIIPPEIPAAILSITAITKEDVIVCVAYSDDSIVRQYRVGENGKWQDYTEPFSVSVNGTIYFRAEDAAGNESTNELLVSNIDKIAPESPIANADILIETNNNVTIYATFSSDTITQEYSFDSKNWNTYTTGIVVTTNGSVYFRGFDEAGNCSEVAEYHVNNIDKIAPQKPIVTADTAPAVNTYVTVFAEFSDDSTVKEYSFDNLNWNEYTNGVTVFENGSVFFRGKDVAGNYSEITEYEVTNIVTIVPEMPVVSADITTATNQNVTVYASFGQDTAWGQYSFDRKIWTAYTDGIVFKQNGTIYFRAVNSDFKVSDIAEFYVNNIDKIAPLAPVPVVNTTALTNENVIVTVTYSEDSMIKQYKIGTDGQWQDYTDAFTVSENGTVYFRAEDAAGNESVSELAIANIDKVAPTLDLTADITTPTNGNVVLTATVSDGMVEYYDGKKWVAGTEYTVSTNGTYQFRVTDVAGNVTEKSIEVTNIDKVAPTLELTADITTPTNGNVVLTATVSDGTVEYFAYGKWNTGDSLTVNVNGTYQFRVTDAAGNENEKSIEVTNIDKVAPEAPEASADIPDPTNQNVTVTATFANDVDVKEYSLDGENWIAYIEGIVFEANGFVWFRGTDAAGNSSQVKYEVANIDKVAPTLELAADVTKPTNGSVTLTATVNDGTVEYFADGKWNTGDSLTINVNDTYQFRATDQAGNVTEKSFKVSNIDKTAPIQPLVAADITDVTNKDVTITATFSEDSVIKHYKIGDGEWQDYIGAFSVSENGTVYFRAEDAASNESSSELVISNIDKAVPGIPAEFNEIISGYNATLDWSDVSDTGVAGVKGYYVRYGTSELLTGDGEFIAASEFDLTDLAVETYFYQVKTEDKAGNISEWSAIQSFEIVPGAVQNLRGGSNGLSWDAIPGVESYIVEYSTDNFASVMAFETTSNKVDSMALPVGTYQWRVKAEAGEFVNGEAIVSDNGGIPQEFVSDADGNTDLFFGKSAGVWGSDYTARHLGTLDGWGGTFEKVVLSGKNKISDIFEGSTDANILVLTDDANGDALFVDDIYTALGEQSRIVMIDEIRTGAGDDVVDMTSQRYGYTGDGVKVYGGLGNDTIWANKGSNTLFGDAGNDRLVGASGNDVIVGGSGNDSMHGGGGEDIFTFGGAFGQDTVEQLAEGSVTLWFETGSESNWNASSLTYTDGVNSVTVSGSVNVTLRFGTDAALPAGAFADAASQKVFEEKGVLA